MSCKGTGGPKCPATGNPNNPASPNARNPTHFPGVSQPIAQAPTDNPFKPEHKAQLEEISKGCEKGWHKPLRVKIMGIPDELFYVCKECLEKWLEEHEELKEVVLGIRV